MVTILLKNTAYLRNTMAEDDLTQDDSVRTLSTNQFDIICKDEANILVAYLILLQICIEVSTELRKLNTDIAL